MEVFFLFILGSCWGSFLYCTRWRWQHQIALSVKRSFCEKCHNNLNFLELIPIWSFLFQRGRCRYCHQPISWLSTLWEISFGCLFCLLTLNHPNYSYLISLFVICWCSWLTIEDLQNFAVSRNLLFGGALLLLFFLKFAGHLHTDFFISAILLLLLLNCFVIIHWLGSADLILLVCSYFLLGFWKLLLLLLIASAGGAITCFFFKTSKLPFIPFITGGIILLCMLSS